MKVSMDLLLIALIEPVQSEFDSPSIHKKRKTRSEQPTPPLWHDAVVKMGGGMEAWRQTLSKGVNERATGGQRISVVKWSPHAAKEDCGFTSVIVHLIRPYSHRLFESWRNSENSIKH